MNLVDGLDHGGGGRSESFTAAGSSRRPTEHHPVRRSNVFGEDDEDDNDVSQHQRGSGRYNGHGRRSGEQDEALLGYSRAGAETKHKKTREKSTPLTIAKQDDANWMEERKRRLGLDRYRKELGSLSGGFGGSKEGEASDSTKASGRATDRIGHEEQHVGLQIRQSIRDEQSGMSNSPADVQSQADGTPSASQAGNSPPPSAPLVDNDDAAARAALLAEGGARDTSVLHERMIIAPPVSEEEALQRDMDTRPNEPTLDDYARMPVDDFGAALLRGMGWKEGMGAGKQRQGPTTAPDVKKRAALLGLGARERPTATQVSSVSNATAARRRPGAPSSSQSQRPERRYVPVIRRDSERNGQALPSRRSRSPPSRSEKVRANDDRERRARHDERRRHPQRDDEERREPRYSTSDRDRHHRHLDDVQKDHRYQRRSDDDPPHRHQRSYHGDVDRHHARNSDRHRRDRYGRD